MGKAPLLDATAQNGVNSSTLSVATWWLYGLAAGFVVLFCKEKRRELCDGDGLQFLWRSGIEDLIELTS